MLDAIHWDTDLIRRYDQAGPRYTSYPTAVQMHGGVGSFELLHALRESRKELRPLSLYVHLPFCAHVCCYCACNKVITKDRGRAIGMDHFALADDELVSAQEDGSLQRNFQSYTSHGHCDLVGLSGMDTKTYPVSAQALETTSVCEIPFDRLDALSILLPQLRRQLMRVMSREIRDDQQMMLLLSKKTADERIATFLVNLSARFRARGFSPNQFRLAMSRSEIGNYLGLAVETVSRVFTCFQQNKLLEAEGKSVHILDPIELCALAGGNLDG